MPKTFDGIRITIALEVLLAVWSRQRSYESRALDPYVPAAH